MSENQAKGGERKCYYKRAKTRERTFKPCDVARIARECVRDQNASEEEVLRCVHRALGYDVFLVRNNRRVAIRGFIESLLFPSKDKPSLFGLENDAIGVATALAGFVDETKTSEQLFEIEKNRQKVKTAWLDIKPLLRRIERVTEALLPGVMVAVDFFVDFMQDYDVASVSENEDKESRAKCKCKFLGDITDGSKNTPAKTQAKRA